MRADPERSVNTGSTAHPAQPKAAASPPQCARKMPGSMDFTFVMMGLKRICASRSRSRSTLSNFDNPDPFSVQSTHSPRIMSQLMLMLMLMLVWSGRRPITQTQKKAMEVVTQVVLSAIER